MTTLSPQPIRAQPTEAVSGVQLAQGIGVAEAMGFWADAWAYVLRRPGAVAALCWLATVLFFAVFSPFLASGHPLLLEQLDADGQVVSTSSPLLRNLTTVDILLALAGLVGVPYVFRASPRGRSRRLGTLLWWFIAAGVMIIAISVTKRFLDGGDVPEWVRRARRDSLFPYAASACIAVIVSAMLMLVPVYRSFARRAAVLGLALTIAVVASGWSWSRPLQIFQYQDEELAGRVRAVYTLVPFSPEQRFSELNRVPPGTSLGEGLGLPPDSAPSYRRFLLGSDAFGQDVLSHLLHACRLAISIGLVSTGIAVLIGVTVGALAGYFGGVIDLLLQRVIEIFMAVPVLFLLIVAAGVLPQQLRNTYVTMAIIGAVTWTSAARYTRAEFLKLRSQDFVQSAKAVGLPLRAILFKHMLPNGVTPVLVDASFLIAGAIIAEATLSYLGLGPIDQASWGKLLSSAMSSEGEFKWWLAVFPGLAIFLTVLSYNIVGETFRDAIDPKLKKARV